MARIELFPGFTHPSSLSPHPSELVPPPQDTLETLYELARLGKMDALQEQARTLEELSDRYRPFADKLYSLAEELEDEQIVALLEQYLASDL